MEEFYRQLITAGFICLCPDPESLRFIKWKKGGCMIIREEESRPDLVFIHYDRDKSGESVDIQLSKELIESDISREGFMDHLSPLIPFGFKEMESYFETLT